MSYRVYISPACRTDAERHAQSAEIESFAIKLERDQSTGQLGRHPPPYLKKTFGKSGRLLIEEVQLDGDTVLCFSRYLIRGDRTYEGFLSNSEQFQRQNPIDLDDVRRTLAETAEPDTPPTPEPSAAESSWLHALSPIKLGEVALLESSDWVERMAEPRTGDLKLRYWEVVYRIVEQANLTEGVGVVANPNNPGVRVLYSWLPDLRRILLVAPLRPGAPEDEADLRKRYATSLAPGAQPTHEEVGRVCRRSYPSIVVYDEEVWMRIQANADANLALSPEEESVLESVMTPGQDRYPLFINGRPGSGKSTLLQYLFSEYLTHAIENGEAGAPDTPPLYLTYSDALLDRAKTVCRSILRCGAKQAAETGGTSDENRIDTLLDVAFRNMKDYLLERLPPEERRRYGRDSYVTFARFRREWNRAREQRPQPEVRRIDPDLAWHAIRTYIVTTLTRTRQLVRRERFEWPPRGRSLGRPWSGGSLRYEQEASANRSVRKHPETFCLTLLMRRSRSARLFVKATWGFFANSSTAVSCFCMRSHRLCASDLATLPRWPLRRGGMGGSSLAPWVRMVR